MTLAGLLRPLWWSHWCLQLATRGVWIITLVTCCVPSTYLCTTSSSKLWKTFQHCQLFLPISLVCFRILPAEQSWICQPGCQLQCSSQGWSYLLLKLSWDSIKFSMFYTMQVSFVNGGTGENGGEKIAFNYGRELFVYPYRWMPTLLELTIFSSKFYQSQFKFKLWWRALRLSIQVGANISLVTELTACSSNSCQLGEA